jgi:hypothetical protein
MSVTRDLEDFVRTHRSCGGMSGDATQPNHEGYFISVVCECGKMFERWVTPEAAEEELRHTMN